MSFALQGCVPELTCVQWLVDPTLQDVDDRPLVESRYSGAGRIPATDLRTCPYPGVRHRHVNPMNVSALRQVRRDWTQICALTADLRRQLGADKSRTSPTTLYDVLVMAAAMVSVPNYLVRRSRPPASRIPGPISGLYKVALGVIGVTYLMCVDRWLAEASVRAPISAATLAEFSERSRALVGAHQVCAGPPEYIRDILQLIVDGPARDTVCSTDEPRLYYVDGQYLEYSRLVLAIELVKQMLVLRRGAIVRDCLATMVANDRHNEAETLRRKYAERRQAFHTPVGNEILDYLIVLDTNRVQAVMRGMREVVSLATERTRTRAQIQMTVDANGTFQCHRAAGDVVHALIEEDRRIARQGIGTLNVLSQAADSIVCRDVEYRAIDADDLTTMLGPSLADVAHVSEKPHA